jgi:Ca-activated chloride channel homolog
VTYRTNIKVTVSAVLAVCLAYFSPTSATAEQEGSKTSTALQAGTQSTTLQTGTSSTTLQTGTSSTTLQTGTQSTLLQTGTDSTMLQTGTQSTLIQGNVEHAGGPVNILFLLDCSFSMKEKLGMGQPQKMEAAKQVLQEGLARIPADINVGLRVFGQGSGMGMSAFSNPAVDCMQTALLVPLGIGNRRTIIEKVRNMKPFGMTPLEFALRQAAEDDLSVCKGQKILILISDGADTCGGDPCRFIRQLPMFGIKLKVDVVGLDIRDRGSKKELNCVAEASGGKYYDANTAAQLIDSVSKSVNTAISGRVLLKENQPAKNTETPTELQPIQPFVAH